MHKHKSLNNSNGIINDELPEGEYIFLFIGSGSTDFTFAQTVYTNSTIDAWMFGYEYNNTFDTFSCRLDCEVKKGEVNSNQVVLQRIVGKVEIILDDIIPKNVSRIIIQKKKYHYIHYNAVSDFYYWENLDERRDDEAYDISATDKTAAGYTISFLEFENIDENNERIPLSITLTALREHTPDEVGFVDPYSTVATKTIENVTIEKNRTTIYRGKLFDNVNSDENIKPSAFLVSMNDEWGEDINKTF